MIKRVMPTIIAGDDIIGVSPMKGPCQAIHDMRRKEKLEKALDEYAAAEIARLGTLGGSGVEAATHLRELVEYAHLLDLDALRKALDV